MEPPNERDAALAATKSKRPALRYFKRYGLFPEEAQDEIFDLMVAQLDRAHPERRSASFQADEQPYLSTDTLYTSAGGGWFCDHQAFGDLLEALVRAGRIDVLRSRQPQGERTDFIYWIRETTATGAEKP